MMARRRLPRAIRPLDQVPRSSGPRWASESVIRSIKPSGSGAPMEPSNLRNPQIPHTSDILPQSSFNVLVVLQEFRFRLDYGPRRVRPFDTSQLRFCSRGKLSGELKDLPRSGGRRIRLHDAEDHRAWASSCGRLKDSTRRRVGPRAANDRPAVLSILIGISIFGSGWITVDFLGTADSTARTRCLCHLLVPLAPSSWDASTPRPLPSVKRAFPSASPASPKPQGHPATGFQGCTHSRSATTAPRSDRRRAQRAPQLKRLILTACWPSLIPSSSVPRWL